MREKIGAVQLWKDPLESGGSPRPGWYWLSTAILVALTGNIRWLSNLRIFNHWHVAINGLSLAACGHLLMTTFRQPCAYQRQAAALCFQIFCIPRWPGFTQTV
ncbi:hypothetical protein GCM10009715_43540 [Paeniglutamicibacter psychrophenolicus]